MSSSIQCLEPRTLFAIANDQAQILLDAAAARIAFVTASAGLQADVKIMAAELKAVTTPANRASNVVLLKALKADVAATRATIRTDGQALVGKCTALARRVAGIGRALEIRPGNAKLQARLAVALPALQAATGAAMTALQADFQAVELDTELNAIVSANPSSTTLAAHAQTMLTDVASAITNLTTAATTFQTSVGILAANADDLPTGPSLVGTYAGSATTTAGSGIGSQIALSIQFTSQSADGTLAGTVTITEANGSVNTMTLTGSVSETGTFTATLVSATPDEGATLSGTVNGTVISGTYTAVMDSGTFSLTRHN